MPHGILDVGLRHAQPIEHMHNSLREAGTLGLVPWYRMLWILVLSFMRFRELCSRYMGFTRAASLGARIPLACQDCEGAPSLELAPERRMSFCWFQPESPQLLKLRLGPKEPHSCNWHSSQIFTAQQSQRCIG